MRERDGVKTSVFPSRTEGTESQHKEKVKEQVRVYQALDCKCVLLLLLDASQDLHCVPALYCSILHWYCLLKPRM